MQLVPVRAACLSVLVLVKVMRVAPSSLLLAAALLLLQLVVL
jgi:hypothetical protein